MSTELADYLVENYLDDSALIPPKIWADKTATLGRTTNACEAFYSKFKGLFPSPHSNSNIF